MIPSQSALILISLSSEKFAQIIEGNIRFILQHTALGSIDSG